MNSIDKRLKTKLCRNWEATGKCRFGDKCHFAHGEQEREVKSAEVVKPVCWYYNNGRCKNTELECKFSHVKMSFSLRKPIQIQCPCVFFHLRTPGHCAHGQKCRQDHFELTEQEWKRHFSSQYPGKGYSKTVSSSELLTRLAVQVSEFKGGTRCGGKMSVEKAECKQADGLQELLRIGLTQVLATFE